ncbi:hypothetical protein QLQ12_23915 [Actinoplanes sp. NEAU-A12]|uniref:Uncharacterized protein n=1 Tax=Actinoplanes sandaracinus TaxID=3045177 RepID=A0ABT6WPK2_9ACTN|nr:hypothetical protein [Actinoplanes sandaracinus]MDI6101673.1 hypothetical protein [Actinoplanes sandaracinus]
MERVLTIPINGVCSVAFSPDGELLVTASSHKTVRLWDSAPSSAVGEPLTGHTHFVTAVAFSPDGRLLASSGDDETVRLWNPFTGTARDKAFAGSDAWSAAFSPDGGTIASASGSDGVSLWKLRSRHTASPVEISEHEISEHRRQSSTLRPRAAGIVRRGRPDHRSL